MSNDSSKQTILIVDDTPINIDILRGLLSPHYRIKAAIDGETALRIARADPPPDLVLLDIMMPGMDGYQVCNHLKSDSTTAHIPIVFITAKGEESDERKGLEMGAVDYIVKPFSPPIVAARVRNHLRLYAGRQALFRENQDLREQVTGGFRDYPESDLRRLINGGENDQLEFKSTLRWNLHTDKADKKIENQCLKTIAAFLNSGGGILLVGVDDDGRALGLEQDRFASEDRMLLHWNSLFRKHIGVEFMPLTKSGIYTLDGQPVLLIQGLSSQEPVFFRRENEEAFYVRTGNSTQQLKPSEVIAYLARRA